MGESEVRALEVGLNALNESVKNLAQSVEQNRRENREEHKRLHERMDAQKDAVTLQECVKYRERCCSKQDSQQDKWMRWALEFTKLLLAAAAGGAAGSKIIGG